MAAHTARERLAAIANDASLFEEANFARRARAIDDLEVHVLDPLGASDASTRSPEAEEARDAAERLLAKLESADRALFERLRSDVRTGRLTGPALRAALERHTAPGREERGGAPDDGRYDLLDLFVNHLLAWRPLPPDPPPRDREMVPYQQTPARRVVDVVDRGWVTAGDHFVDLGSGLGQVALLVHLLTGAAATGVEVEPELCAYARASAEALGLARVTFTNADARVANVSEGSVFFLYSPFVGSILASVLGRLRREARARRFKVVSYGPLTRVLAAESWLERLGPPAPRADGLVAFASGPEGVTP